MPASVVTYLAAQIVRALPRTAISRAVGRLCDAPLPPRLSRAVVQAYSKAWNVEMDDIEPQPQPYRSFDDFFTRPLRDGRRPVSTVAHDFVSPSDGKLQSIGPIESGCRIVVKNKPYDVARLVGNDDDARDYVGGQFAVVYLSPRDYHRVHAPVDGALTLVRSLAGDLHPVNAIGDISGPTPLVLNRRVVAVFETASFGRVTLVFVGAMVVGRISLVTAPDSDVPLGHHAVDPPRAFRRGEEVGAFHLGSTAVILAGPQAPAWHRSLGLIRVGESLTRNG